VVEIFMTDWLASKVTREPEFFERVPDVLRDWVKFAGQRQGVPAAALREAVAAVKRYRHEMLEVVNDPETSGPARRSRWRPSRPVWTCGTPTQSVRSSSVITRD
jgi:hypothetical protein